MAALLLVVYGLWLYSVFHTGYQPRDFIHISPNFLNQSHVSAVIKVDPAYPTYNANGYDGQFFYYLALDPMNARYYMDAATYRYTRILYPVLARALALGNPQAIPVTLIVINWLALAGGTAALAAWLKRRGFSPWIALVFGLYPGLQFALARDLSEILSYSLVAGAVLIFDSRRPWRLPVAALVFALAALSRETSALFALVYGLAVLAEPAPGLTLVQSIKSRWRDVCMFLAIALLPLLVWKLFLLAWLGPQHDAGIPFARLPFLGLWQWRYWQTPALMEQVRSVVVPGLVAGGAAAIGLRWLPRRPEVWLLLANVVVFVIFLQAPSYADYSASGRVTTGVVLSAILALPWLRPRIGAGWFAVSSALWLALTPFWLIFPTMQYVLHTLPRVPR